MPIKYEFEGWDDVLYDPDEQEKIELEYVYALADYIDEPESSVSSYPDRFWDRVCHGDRIKEPFTKEQFLKEQEIIATIKAFDLDVNKFWWAVLFIYDWSMKQFTNCMDTESPATSVQNMLDYIGGSHDIEITFRVKGKKSRNANQNVKSAVMFGLREKLKCWKGATFTFEINEDNFTTTFSNSSYQMCFATAKFKELFEALKLPSKGTASKTNRGSITSCNKMLLISRLLYFMRLTRNPKFNDSEDSLKGVLKAYANKLPSTLPEVYGM